MNIFEEFLLFVVDIYGLIELTGAFMYLKLSKKTLWNNPWEFLMNHIIL